MVLSRVSIRTYNFQETSLYRNNKRHRIDIIKMRLHYKDKHVRMGDTKERTQKKSIT